MQFNEVRAGGSYISQNDPRLHFGTGAESRMSEVEIRWPSGKVEVLRDVPTDLIYTIVEDQGIPASFRYRPPSQRSFSFSCSNFPSVGLCLTPSFFSRQTPPASWES